MMAQMVANIQQGSARIDRLISDLKDFARSSETERREPCDVREIVRAACTILSAVIRRATDTFELNLPREAVNLRCNANQIEQVAINLISNACAALRTPSEAIRVTLDRLAPNYVRIQVQDEGNGIEPEMIERLTDPFFTTRQEAGGIGLGLAISERIVADHGGTISFASEAGAGTTVTVLIPELEQDGSILVETRTSGRAPS
jgi:polar amino acid transport system substrate-binding protein